MGESPSFAPEEDLPFIDMFKQNNLTEKLGSAVMSKYFTIEINSAEALKKSQTEIQDDDIQFGLKNESGPIVDYKFKRVNKSKHLDSGITRCNPERVAKSQTLLRLKEEINEDLDESKEAEFKEDEPEDPKKKRWGREEDKKLFNLVREMDKEGTLTFDELKTIRPSQAHKHEGVCLLTKRFGWKAIARNLLYRIENLQGRDFSVREVKHIKNIVKREYKYKDIDYEKVIYHFPGKSLARVIEVCDMIVKGRFDKTLSDLHLCQYKRTE